jgi:hypothetical protein
VTTNVAASRERYVPDPETSIVAELDALLARRMRGWCQTEDLRLPDPDAAAAFIERVALATLFPASPEVPNLFHAHLGNPEARTDSGHDTPSGEVYGWRWALGRRGAAFYGTVVRNRPTWVAWHLLPAVLRLRRETRSPEDLHQAGLLSPEALRIAAVLKDTGGPLSTGELRRAAGFPTGKAERAAYLRAVAELDGRLLVAKVFSPDPDDLDMAHALVAQRYPDAVTAAEALTREAALDRLLAAYLPAAAYARPTPLARHLGLPEPELRAGLTRLVAAGQAESISLPGQRDASFAWRG